MRAAWIAIVLIACGGGRSEPNKPIANVTAKPPADAAVDAPADDMAVALAKMTDFTERMCQCKDQACAEAVTQAMTDWAQTMAKDDKTRQQLRPSDAQVKQMATIAERMSSCMTKVMTPPNAGSATG